MRRSKDELVMALGQVLIADRDFRDTEWDAVSLVGRVYSAGNSRMHGYRYFGDDEWEAFGPSEDGVIEVLDLLEALNAAMRDESGQSWKNCLIQITKPDYAIAIDFEYEDGRRWIGGASRRDSLTESVLALRPERPPDDA